MTTRNAFAAIGGFFDVLGSAVAVSQAVEARRQPRARDLRTLGIDPALSARSSAAKRLTAARTSVLAVVGSR